MEEVVWSFYIWRGIWRKLFGVFIFEEKYYKEWRNLFRIIILVERYNKNWRKLFKIFILIKRY